MAIEIRRLTPELVEDYIHFFDTTPHDTYVDEHKCYCVCWCNDDYEGKDFSTVEYRRKYAYQYVQGNNIQGYLAYEGDTVVGWCNAQARMDCLKSAGWRWLMDFVPLDPANEHLKVKSIFCFVVAPGMKRKGIATGLLEQVCKDAKIEGFDVVEAYPYIESSDRSSDFSGHVAMYEKCGFTLILNTEKGPIMRKGLKT
ncbi:MAG: GNAT family N-acetyltransferase [Candidatus Izemoplasmatales bacterium]|jgi:GNAT superfamily N-acetyltransferase